MRKDIYRVVRAPKGGRTWISKTQRNKQVALDTEGEQVREVPKHPPLKKVKGRSYNLNPLKRFLVRRVGRPWDSVYAEVCATADARSFLGSEVRAYIQSFVATDCWIEGRTTMTRHCGGAPKPIKGLYVCPKSGILKRIPE